MKIKKIYPAMGLSLGLLFVFNKVAKAAWDVSSLDAYDLPDPSDGIYGIISNILEWLLTIVGIAGVIGFIIAGLMYLTSTGEEAKIKVAKSAMTASIMGVIVAICGVVVIKAVDNILNAESAF